MGWEGVEADERVEEDVVCVYGCLSVEAVACDGFVRARIDAFRVALVGFVSPWMLRVVPKCLVYVLS